MMSKLAASLHVKIASGVIVTIVLTSALYFLAEYRSHRRQLLADLQRTADQLSSVSLHGLLELAMIGEHPEMLQQAIERLGANSPAKQILLLDLSGMVRFASDPSQLGHRFTQMEEGCQNCHTGPSPPRHQSEFIEMDGQPILRSVSPVPNRPECHSCHDPSRSHNGVLVIDFPTGAIWSQLQTDFYETLLLVGLTVLFTLLVLGILMNKLVISPLARLTRATARLADQESSKALADLQGPGEIGQLAGSFSQMSARVRTSINELQSQQAYLQNLMNSLPDGLIVVDQRHRVVMTNQAAAGIWTPPQLEDILSPQGLFPEIGQALLRTLEKGEPVTCELKLEARQNGESRFVEVHASPLKNARDEIENAILLIRDVTGRKRFEAQASRTDRLASVGRLAAGLAHEINNPMAAITTCVEGLSRYVAKSEEIVSHEKEEIQDYLATVGEAALRCKEITQRLLSASVERGPTEFEPTDLPEIIQNAVTLVGHEARRHKVVINTNLLCNGYVILGNREKLSQLALNLLLNSLEAVDDGGQIDVSMSRHGDLIELRIADNGCGIPEENLEHIFDPFFSTKAATRGTGLGLSISQWIVRQHQARMHVQSKLGEGTSFSILFPGLEKGAE